MFLNIFPMTQLIEWCFWINMLEQFKNKKQLFVALKKNRDNLNTFKYNFNYTHREKLCFIPFSIIIYKNRCLAAPDLCLYIPLSHIEQCIFFNKVTHEIDRKWVVLLSVTFTAKLNWKSKNTENYFAQEVKFSS